MIKIFHIRVTKHTSKIRNVEQTVKPILARKKVIKYAPDEYFMAIMEPRVPKQVPVKKSVLSTGKKSGGLRDKIGTL